MSLFIIVLVLVPFFMLPLASSPLLHEKKVAGTQETQHSVTHPVHRPPLVAADAYPDKAANDGLGEYWKVDKTLHLVARESDLLQVLSTRDKLRSGFS